MLVFVLAEMQVIDVTASFPLWYSCQKLQKMLPIRCEIMVKSVTRGPVVAGNFAEF